MTDYLHVLSTNSSAAFPWLKLLHEKHLLCYRSESESVCAQIYCWRGKRCTRIYARKRYLHVHIKTAYIFIFVIHLCWRRYLHLRVYSVCIHRTVTGIQVGISVGETHCVCIRACNSCDCIRVTVYV